MLNVRVPGGHEVGPLQQGRRLGKGVAGAVDQAAARDAELAGEGREGEDRADSAAAVLVRSPLMKETDHETHISSYSGSGS